jgi:hypothetical protein
LCTEETEQCDHTRKEGYKDSNRKRELLASQHMNDSLEWEMLRTGQEGLMVAEDQVGKMNGHLLCDVIAICRVKQ